MCPPVGGSREGTYPGRHMGRPLQSRLQCPASPEERAGTEPRPYRATRGAKQRADVPKAWPPSTKFRAEIWGVSHRHRPLRKRGEFATTALASGAERSVCGADARDRRRVRQRASPKCPATSDNPSVAAKPRQLPLHKGALACGGRGGHRPVIGVPSNPRRGGTEPAPYRKAGNTQRAGAINAQGRSEICRAIVDLVFRKAECSE